MVDTLALKKALGRFPSGVAIVTTADPNTRQALGLTISSFSSVSLNPPLILWSLQNQSALLPVFQRLPHYQVHILRAGMGNLALQFSRGTPTQRFANVHYTLDKHGSPVLADDYIGARFSCVLQQCHLAGDHHILVGEVLDCQHAQVPPLIYHAGQFLA